MMTSAEGPPASGQPGPEQPEPDQSTFEPGQPIPAVVRLEQVRLRYGKVTALAGVTQDIRQAAWSA